MSIKGTEGLSTDEINFELQRGAKFVIYQYCISILIMTFKRPSQIYFVKVDESSVTKGLAYTLISLIFGWWGIPWGPIYTIGSLISNFGGGTDVTAQILSSVNATAPSETAQ
tara:strand:- start:50 stop:385 length:336 start_codon:yes stop_codon:yes gene_type:complete